MWACLSQNIVSMVTNKQKNDDWPELRKNLNQVEFLVLYKRNVRNNFTFSVIIIFFLGHSNEDKRKRPA